MPRQSGPHDVPGMEIPREPGDADGLGRERLEQNGIVGVPAKGRTFTAPCALLEVRPRVLDVLHGFDVAVHLGGVCGRVLLRLRIAARHRDCGELGAPVVGGE